CAAKRSTWSRCVTTRPRPSDGWPISTVTSPGDRRSPAGATPAAAAPEHPTARRSGGGAALRQGAEEIHLAELDAVVAQQRVRRRHVEEEVRQRQVLEARLG